MPKARYLLLIEEDLKAQLETEARKNYRSLAAEINFRLERSLQKETNPGSAINTPGAVQTSLAEAEHEHSESKPIRNSP